MSSLTSLSHSSHPLSPRLANDLLLLFDKPITSIVTKCVHTSPSVNLDMLHFRVEYLPKDYSGWRKVVAAMGDVSQEQFPDCFFSSQAS